MEQTNDNQLQGAEILFGFLGWLTSRKTAVTFSWHHGTSDEAVKLLERFCETNGLSTDCRDHWDKRLTHPPVLPGEDLGRGALSSDPDEELRARVARLMRRLAAPEAEGQSDKAKPAIEACP